MEILNICIKALSFLSCVRSSGTWTFDHNRYNHTRFYFLEKDDMRFLGSLAWGLGVVQAVSGFVAPKYNGTSTGTGGEFWFCLCMRGCGKS